jgi:hypothetical protein
MVRGASNRPSALTILRNRFAAKDAISRHERISDSDALVSSAKGTWPVIETVFRERFLRGATALVALFFDFGSGLMYFAQEQKVPSPFSITTFAQLALVQR